uniref:SSD domain-containing protein n=1 Tax=Parascaris univalens TaxID=6257 RepID=A0A915AF44_PARUN
MSRGIFTLFSVARKHPLESCAMQLANPGTLPTREGETLFVRYLNSLFRYLGSRLSKRPWLFIFVTTSITLAMSAAIPLTKMTNDISDFTPYAARARSELQVYESFFSNEGEPIVVFILLTRKDGGSMFGTRQLNETIRVLDGVTSEIYFHNSARNVSSTFLQLCTSFCTINEPVRQFYVSFFRIVS